MKKVIILMIVILSFISIRPKTTSALQNPEAAVVSTGGSNLNLRSAPNTSSSVLGKLKDGSYVTLITKHSNFYYARVGKSTYGYLHKDYLKTLASRPAVTLDNLNIRSYGSTSATILTTLPKGSNVVILSSSTYWSKVLFNGNQIGYAYNTYLKSSNSINISVTNYKQFDSRWAYEEIVPGSTMKEIGCLTTSFAITESKRTGMTITPSMMRKNLQYTSNGSAYWPSNYTQSQSSNYLSITLSKLKEGKPVIMGLKKANGSMHFFVVCGYSGDSLAAKNFKISDPGSSTRKNLAEVIAEYPYFYKIAYYN